ncbi:MAG: DUF5666 domain-containing protein [Candidatus Moranbacteria bacterium]|nr:DUF5666 domain-containing protein [Candidatus Moranbacteria bacterium]
MEKIKSKKNILKKLILVLVSAVAVMLVLNAVLFFIGLKIGHFERWTGEQYFGEIVEMDGNSFVLDGRGNKEKRTVLIGNKTEVKKGMKDSRKDLGVGDQVMVLGPLDKSGQVEASFIRIFDPNDPLDKLPKNLPYF